MASWLCWPQLPNCSFLLHWFCRFPPFPSYLQIALPNNKKNAMVWAVGSFIWWSFRQEEAVFSNKNEFVGSMQTPNSHPTHRHFFKASRPFYAIVCSSLPSECESVTHGMDKFRYVAFAVKSAHITIIGYGSLWNNSTISKDAWRLVRVVLHKSNPAMGLSSGVQWQ